MREKPNINVDKITMTLVPYPHIRGLQEYVIELSRRLGLSLVVVASNNESLRVEIVELHRILNKDLHVFYAANFDVYRNPVLIYLNRLRELRKVLREFEVAHFYGQSPFMGSLILHGLDHIFTHHFDIALASLLANVVARIYDNLLLKEVLRDTGVLKTSDRAFVEKSHLLNSFNKRLVILPLGLDTRSLRPTCEYLSRVVLFGRIVPEKGVHVLLDAFEKLTIEIADFELSTIGKPVDTKYHRRLKELTESKGTESEVHFTGCLERNEMLRSLASSSVLVLSFLARLDSFGTIILEISALAVLIVFSNVMPGAKEFVERAQNSFVERPGTMSDHVRVIRESLQSPREYGDRGRHYVTARHDGSVVIDQARDILSRCTYK